MFKFFIIYFLSWKLFDFFFLKISEEFLYWYIKFYFIFYRKIEIGVSKCSNRNFDLFSMLGEHSTRSVELILKILIFCIFLYWNSSKIFLKHDFANSREGRVSSIEKKFPPILPFFERDYFIKNDLKIHFVKRSLIEESFLYINN